MKKNDVENRRRQKNHQKIGGYKWISQLLSMKAKRRSSFAAKPWKIIPQAKKNPKNNKSFNNHPRHHPTINSIAAHYSRL
jgi:hypothetical protein